MPRIVKTPRSGDVLIIGDVVIKCRKPKRRRARLAMTINTPAGIEVRRVRKSRS